MNLNQKIKRVSSVLLAVFILCSLTACGKQKSNLQIVEQLEQEPQYLSFFSGKNYGQSDLGKYWSDRFVDIYNQQVYVNYDGAAYYADENLSYRELLERRMESASPDDLYIISAEDVLEFEKRDIGWICQIWILSITFLMPRSIRAHIMERCFPFRLLLPDSDFYGM